MTDSSMRRGVNVTVGLVVLISAVTMTMMIGSATAQAQEVTPVVGTADFRSPPQLRDGTYEDMITSGETVWYTVMYRNDTPYRFEVSTPDSASTLPISISLIRPNLVPAATPSSVVEGSGVQYPASHTNLWYLAISFDPSVQAGTSHRVRIDIDGVEDTRLVDCPQTADCTLDQELARVVGELASVEDDLADYEGVESTSAVAVEIQNIQGSLETGDTLRPQAEGRLAAAKGTLAQLCAPEPTCEAPSRGTATPAWAMAFGLVALVGGGAKAIKRPRSTDDDEPDVRVAESR